MSKKQLLNSEDAEDVFEPQYPAELYTKRPNKSALLSPLYDWTFKQIFTQETEESNLALKSFISAVLGRQISTVTVKNNEPGKQTRKQKSMTFDVSVQFDDGELADIELQAHKEDCDYGMRAEIQAARLLTNNAKKGQRWISEKVYQISVLNFQYKNNDNKEMRWYTMTDSFGARLTDRQNIIFIDLVAIRKQHRKNTSVEKLSPLEKWGLFFSYVDRKDKKDLVKNIINTEKGIMAAKNIVKDMSKPDNNWYVQNSRWVAKRDAFTIKDNARKKAIAEGRAEGRAEGLAEGHAKGLAQGLAEGKSAGLAEGAQKQAIETAKKMLKKHFPSDEVVELTGLPLEKVLELQKTIKVKA